MTVKGIVKNGVVVLDQGVKLPEGLKVEVSEIRGGSLGNLMKFAGAAKRKYPRDYARNHDHYIHGARKK